jgi:hypothetical protein
MGSSTRRQRELSTPAPNMTLIWSIIQTRMMYMHGLRRRVTTRECLLATCNMGGNNSQSLNSSQSYRLASNTHARDVQPTFDSRREEGKRLSFRKPNTPAEGA